MKYRKGKFVQPVEKSQIQFLKSLLIRILADLLAEKFNVLVSVQALMQLIS
jgi:hypothetical protein